MGPVGTAITMKIAINLAAPTQLLAFSEGVLLAEKAGVDRRAVVLDHKPSDVSAVEPVRLVVCL